MDDDCDYRAAGRAGRGAGRSRAATRYTAGDVAASEGDRTLMYGRHHRLLGLRRRTTGQRTAESHRYLPRVS